MNAVNFTSTLPAMNSTRTYTTETPPGSSTEYDYIDYGTGDYGRCEYEQHGVKFLPALYTIFFILGLLGNSLVIWVIACGVRLRSMTDVCLLNLAVADLLLVCSLPFLAHQARAQWDFGDAMCKLVLGVYHIVLYCGIFFICLMSIDRYLAIVHAICAMKARTRSIGIIAAVVAWAVGFIASFPDVLYLKEQVNGGIISCYPEYPKVGLNETSTHLWKVFSLVKMNVLGLFVPLLILGYCYSRIVWTLLFSQSSKRQAIRVVIIVVATFVCCWLPYNVVSFVKVLELSHVHAECESSKAIFLALQITEAIAYSHSCLNPILYVFVGQKFRRHLRRMIMRAPCKPCQLIKVYIPQDRSSVQSQTSSIMQSTGL
ncbi:C-C chemokine receptor type 5 [Betta splendens]|uniref:C-C chemokine receptor type 5 n=1 Tax=Betta splendens TaxID=158456 RepID=A0A6P7L065_BETSP|nr:C-C chemokine receptor type 5 [Betta splendens]